jgi:hypothetical protein
VARSEESSGLQRDQQRAFALLTEVGELTEADRADAAVAAAGELVALFAERPADPTLAGFGAMVLDAALWLVARERDADALALCDALVARLCEGSAAERGIAAGGRFLAAQTAARLNRVDRARVELEALSAMGEPALAGLERMAGRLAAAGASAAWHAQVAAATVTVLWRLGRGAEARALARETAASFARLGEPELRARLEALEREISGAA